jgi:hypothetical protein
MILLLLENSTWEFHYIKNELLNDIPNLMVEKFTKETFHQLESRDDLISNSIIIINGVCNLSEIIKIATKIKPLIVFYLSDEGGCCSSWTILEQYTKLLFRQYNFGHYKYSKNNYQSPLGYVTNYLNNNSSNNISKKPICDRTINASFIGTPKSDRVHMSNIFNKNMKNTKIIFVNNNWDIPNLPYSPQDCFDTYNDSIFVLCGRGNSNLDCFRIYEAIVAGAIPITIGSKEEINITFNYNNNLMPILFFDTWEIAVLECNKLLHEPQKLIDIQKNISSWWINQHDQMKSLIRSVIENP